MITRICTTCKKELPLTREFFYYKKNGLGGLNSVCQNCAKEYRRRHRKKQLALNPDYDKEQHQKYKTKRKEYARNWFKENKALAYIWHKRWLATEKGKEIMRYHKIKDTQRRRQIIKGLPSTLTKEQWENCLKEFNYFCAFCGEKLETITIDHFIPLSKNGELSVWNALPCCFSCNSSKNNKDFFEWYPVQEFYSETRKKKILKYLNYTKEKYQLLRLIG